MRSVKLIVAAAAIAALPAVTFSQQYTLQRSNSISLGDVFFGGASPSVNGSNPISVGFDGTNAYVGGFNGVNTPTGDSSVGIVRIDNAITGTTAKTPLPGTQLVLPTNRGFGSVAAFGGGVYAVNDTSGNLSSGTSLRRYDTSGNLQWQVSPGSFSTSGYYPNALAIDPLADNGSPALGMVASLGGNTGRRVAVRLSDGTLLYNPSGGTSVFGSGAIIATAPGPYSANGIGFTFRGLAFDSVGNIATAAEGGAGFGLRDTQGGTNFNRFTNLAGAAGSISVANRKATGTNNGLAQGIAILEGAADTSLLAYSARIKDAINLTYDLTMTDNTGNAQPGLDARHVQIRHTDGSLGSLTQTSLAGSEDFLTGSYTDDVKTMTAGKDANNNPVLLVTSFTERRLDVYSIEPTFIASGGDWDSPGNWLLNLVPDGRTQNARFRPAAAPATVTLDSARTSKLVRFDSAQPYTVSGTGTLSLDGPDTYGAHIQVLQGSHTIAVPVISIKGTDLRVPVGSTLTLATGISGGGLTKRDLGEADVRSFRMSATTVAEGTLRVLPNGGSAGASRTGDLNIANDGLGTYSAKLDLTNNGLAVATTPYSAVREALLAGRNGGDYTGNGLTSSTAAANAVSAAIGIATAGDLGLSSFLGISVSSTDTLVRYTRQGDADLSGNVDLDDFTRLAGSFGLGGEWANGDFNFSGGVDLDDFTILAANFGLSAPADVARNTVPEPSVSGLFALSAVGLARRGKR